MKKLILIFALLLCASTAWGDATEKWDLDAMMRRSETPTYIDSLVNIPACSTTNDGQAIYVAEFSKNTQLGGGFYVCDGSTAQSTANGGTVIDQSVFSSCGVDGWSGYSSDLADYYDSSTGQGFGSGSGVWTYISPVQPSVLTFGARANGTTDDTLQIQANFDALDVNYFPEGDYRTTSSIFITGSYWKVWGDGNHKSVIKPDVGTWDVFVLGTRTTLSSGNWVLSGNGTNEYYYNDSSLSTPYRVFVDQSIQTSGDGVDETAGTLAVNSWDWADNDTLGFSTVYLRTDTDLTLGAESIFSSKMINEVEMYGLHVDVADGNKSGGAIISIEGSIVNGNFHDLLFQHFYDGFKFKEGCTTTYISKIHYSQSGRSSGRGRYGITNTGGTNAQKLSSLHLSDLEMSGFLSYETRSVGMDAHFYLASVDGLYASRVHCFYAESAIHFAPDDDGDADTISSVNLSNWYFDSSGAHHIQFAGRASNAYQSIEVTNSLFRDSSDVSVFFVPGTTDYTVDTVIFDGNIWRDNLGTAFGASQTNALTNLILTDNIFDNNNTSNPASTTEGDVIIRTVGGNISDNTFLGGGTNGTALYLLSGSEDNIAADNNFQQSTAAATVIDGGTGNSISYLMDGGGTYYNTLGADQLCDDDTSANCGDITQMISSSAGYSRNMADWGALDEWNDAGTMPDGWAEYGTATIAKQTTGGPNIGSVYASITDGATYSGMVRKFYNVRHLEGQTVNFKLQYKTATTPADEHLFIQAVYSDASTNAFIGYKDLDLSSGGWVEEEFTGNVPAAPAGEYLEYIEIRVRASKGTLNADTFYVDDIVMFGSDYEPSWYDKLGIHIDDSGDMQFDRDFSDGTNTAPVSDIIAAVNGVASISPTYTTGTVSIDDDYDWWIINSTGSMTITLDASSVAGKSIKVFSHGSSAISIGEGSGMTVIVNDTDVASNFSLEALDSMHCDYTATTVVKCFTNDGTP
mgnify:CR=1 FL=1